MISKSEKSFIQTGILNRKRGDGRSEIDWRSLCLETGIAPIGNGSVRVRLGSGTNVIAATKLEVEEEGRLVVNVSCSPAAYPNHTTNALEDVQHDLTTLLSQTLSHSSLHPNNLVIIPGKKAWSLSLDVLVLSDEGNIFDAIFIAATAALWDTKVPRTRSVEYRATTKKNPTATTMDVDQDVESGFDTRTLKLASDFELADYWDDGEVLDGRDRWPVCVTLNVESTKHYLDATLQEESATYLRLLLIYSFPTNSTPKLQGTRMFGAGELSFTQLKDLIKAGEGYAKDLHTALVAKLKDEDLRRTQKARERFEQRR